MTESRLIKAGALVRAETLQANALAVLGYCSLFVSVIGNAAGNARHDPVNKTGRAGLRYRRPAQDAAAFG